jgi:hypothetical protein
VCVILRILVSVFDVITFVLLYAVDLSAIKTLIIEGTSKVLPVNLLQICVLCFHPNPLQFLLRNPDGWIFLDISGYAARGSQ